MIFWGILAGGFLGGVTATKNRVLGNWFFLISSIFSTYLAILLTPEVAAFLKDFKQVPAPLKSGGTTVILFILFMIIFNKIFKAVTGEEEFLDDLPEKVEKLVNFIMGALSGLIFTNFVFFCAVAIFPGPLSGDTFEVKKERVASIKNCAERLLCTGNIFTFSYSYGEKQKKVLNAILPDPVEKKPDKISAVQDGKNIRKKENRGKKSSPVQNSSGKVSVKNTGKSGKIHTETKKTVKNTAQDQIKTKQAVK